MEEYIERKIHKGESEPWSGNVNTVYFINQGRRNTQISRTEFMMKYHVIATVYLYLSFLLRIMFVKNVLLQIGFYA